MSAPKWTPGPWFVEGKFVWHEQGIAAIAEVFRNIAGPDPNEEAADANAHLIAAAPDMYKACAEFVRKVEAGEARSVRSYAQMKDALAKARGETS